VSPIRVAIDTSVFRRDPRLRSGAFEALARFAESGYVEILIPDIVAKEFTSLPVDKAQALAGSRKALADLRRRTPDDFAPIIDKFEADVAEEFRRIEVETEATFGAWLARSNATLNSTGGGHTERVLAKYFAGERPFKSKKSRADFPDAFIVEVLADLAAEKELFVVTADKRMADALQDTPKVTVVQDLKSLLESDDFNKLRSEVESSNVPHLLRFVTENRFIFDDDIKKGVTAILSGSSVRYFSSWDDRGRGESLFIEGIGHIVEWTIDTEGAEYLGEGVVSMSFGATVEVDLEQPSDGSHYYGDEYMSSSPMEAILEVIGACSLIVRDADLANPTAKDSIEEIIEHSRIEVDDLDEITIKMTDRERW
jgi:hypothetical protein